MRYEDLCMRYGSINDDALEEGRAHRVQHLAKRGLRIPTTTTRSRVWPHHRNPLSGPNPLCRVTQ